MNEEQKNTSRGQVLVLIALGLVVLILFVGLAIDGGMAYLKRREMQNAADAAALAGTQQLFVEQLHASINEEKLLSEIYNLAEINGVEDTDGNPGNDNNDNVVAYYTNQYGVRISNTPIGDGANGTDARGVEVITFIEFDTVFMQIAGLRTASSQAMAAAAYKAETDASGGYAIMATSDQCLDEGDGGLSFEWSGGGTLVSGNVHTNDNLKIDDSSNTINGDFTYSSTCEDECSSYDLEQTGYVSPPVYDMAKYAPYGYYYNILNSQGLYHEIPRGTKLVAGDNFTGEPGLYYVKDADADLGDSDVTANVTIVVDNGIIKLSGSSTYYTAFTDDGMLFYSNMNHGSPKENCAKEAIDMSGSKGEWNGIIYAPSAQCKIQGSENQTTNGSVICYSIYLSGADMTINYSGTGSTEPFLEKVYLVE